MSGYSKNPRSAARGSGRGSCSVKGPRGRREPPLHLQSSNLFTVNKLPVLLRYVSLPDKLEDGHYDAIGNRIPAGSCETPTLVLTELGGGIAWQCWAAFDRPLKPGQYGVMVLNNVAGTAIPGGAFTEWKRSVAEPFFSDKLLTVHSVQRKLNAARIIGRNSSSLPVEAAAGILYSPPLE